MCLFPSCRKIFQGRTLPTQNSFSCSETAGERGYWIHALTAILCFKSSFILFLIILSFCHKEKHTRQCDRSRQLWYKLCIRCLSCTRGAMALVTAQKKGLCWSTNSDDPWVLHGHQCSNLQCVSCKVDPYGIGASISLYPPALSASPVSIFPLRLPQSKIFIWTFFCLFLSRQEVWFSAKLTIDPVENSTNYDVTVTVKSNVAKCIW